MTDAVELPTTVDATDAAAQRARGRVVEVAANLLASLDYTGATDRLPADGQAHVSRLRHAVKLAIHPTTTSSLVVGGPPPAAAPPPPAGGSY
jgi:hypothetical protein